MNDAYGKYRNIRDSSWLCLRDFSVSSLPVDVLKIARDSGIKVIKNADVGELRDNEIGLSYYDGVSWFIIYNEKDPIERCRFTLAHEIGHIFLGHSLVSARNPRTIALDLRNENENEKEADMFAARLLCPACVLWGLNLHTPYEISTYCRVSMSAAKIRAQRMSILYKRGEFLTNPLEREVYCNFYEYIHRELAERQRKNAQK